MHCTSSPVKGTSLHGPVKGASLYGPVKGASLHVMWVRNIKLCTCYIQKKIDSKFAIPVGEHWVVVEAVVVHRSAAAAEVEVHCLEPASLAVEV